MNARTINGSIQTTETLLNVPIVRQNAHHKMTQMQTATVHEAELTDHEKLLLLKERARALARAPEQTSVVGVQLKITEFRLGTQTYAFDSSAIREVYAFKELTPLPGTPPLVLGIINVRGRILPVIDIAPLFGLSLEDVNAHNTAIIIKAGEFEVGILTPTVIGVRQLPLAAILSPLSTLTTARSRYLRGITSEGLIILDAQKLLMGTRLGNHE